MMIEIIPQTGRNHERTNGRTYERTNRRTERRKLYTPRHKCRGIKREKQYPREKTEIKKNKKNYNMLVNQ